MLVLGVHTRGESESRLTVTVAFTREFNQRPLHIRGMTNLKGRSRKEIR